MPVVILSLLWAKWCFGGCAGLPSQRPVGVCGLCPRSLGGQRVPRGARGWLMHASASVVLGYRRSGGCSWGSVIVTRAASGCLLRSRGPQEVPVQWGNADQLQCGGWKGLSDHSVRVTGGFVACGGLGVHRSSNRRLRACNSLLTSWQRWKLAHP